MNSSQNSLRILTRSINSCWSSLDLPKSISKPINEAQKRLKRPLSDRISTCCQSNSKEKPYQPECVPEGESEGGGRVLRFHPFGRRLKKSPRTCPRIGRQDAWLKHFKMEKNVIPTDSHKKLKKSGQPFR